jgi:excisionase family DNA binding protein
MRSSDTNCLVFSVEETRGLLGLSRGLMYEAVRTGQIPSVRIGRRILIPRATLQRLLDEAGTTNSIRPMSK